MSVSTVTLNRPAYVIIWVSPSSKPSWPIFEGSSEAPSKRAYGLGICKPSGSF